MEKSYIDTHIHILPGLDDGAQTMDDACRMAEMAVKDGISVIAATPHCLNGKYSPTKDQILAAVDALQSELDQRKIPLIIYPGAELHSHVQLKRLLYEDSVLTMGLGQYVLLEWPDEIIPSYMDSLVFELATAGFKPIIAHPERHPMVQEDPNILYDYLNRGALAQVTATSITGGFGGGIQSVAKTLLLHGMAQLIATDAHSLRVRKPILSDAVITATSWIGEEEALKLSITNPQAVLNGEPIAVSAEPVATRKPWWRRWFSTM